MGYHRRQPAATPGQYRIMAGSFWRCCRLDRADHGLLTPSRSREAPAQAWSDVVPQASVQATRRRRREWVPYVLMIAPYLLGLSVLVVIPAIAGFGMAFVEYNALEAPTLRRPRQLPRTPRRRDLPNCRRQLPSLYRAGGAAARMRGSAHCADPAAAHGAAPTSTARSSTCRRSSRTWPGPSSGCGSSTRSTARSTRPWLSSGSTDRPGWWTPPRPDWPSS